MQPTIEPTAQALSAEQRLQELGFQLPIPPEPFGAYREEAGSLLSLSGTLPTEGRARKFVGRVGVHLDVAPGRAAARLAAMNAVAIARQHLDSLDRVKQVVRLGVSVAAEGTFRELPKMADGASGKQKNPSGMVHGVANLPLGTPVEVELLLQVEG